ncbi:hypothetical protein [Psychroflexus aestuariivivens]|uniref:hypothetical protein n=1 Tax=Psychroflexus aestuariivivens TaxID=1795040 RepID=UPI000FDB4931|nr:hypothetical protein [Psychroflexus aestuariivivens]
MAFKEIIDKNGVPHFYFQSIFGGGWEHDLMTIVVKHINPLKIERKLYKAGWHSSESEIIFQKNGIDYSIFLGEMDSIEFKPISKNFILEFAREFAKIIDTQSEKIQKHINQSKN